MKRFALRPHLTGDFGRLTWLQFCIKYRLGLKIKRGVWSMEVASLEAMIGEVLRFRQNNSIRIVEFGSGASTLVLDKLLPRHFADFALVSFESDPAYLADLRKELRVDSRVSVCLAPLAPLARHRSPAESAIWYDEKLVASAVDSLARVDLAVIDGPPDTVCQFSRWPAFEAIQHRLTPTSIVFLHDTSRVQERLLAASQQPFFFEWEAHEFGLGYSVLRFPREPKDGG